MGDGLISIKLLERVALAKDRNNSNNLLPIADFYRTS
jgi:hypothetical protein